MAAFTRSLERAHWFLNFQGWLLLHIMAWVWLTCVSVKLSCPSFLSVRAGRGRCTRLNLSLSHWPCNQRDTCRYLAHIRSFTTYSPSHHNLNSILNFLDNRGNCTLSSENANACKVSPLTYTLHNFEIIGFSYISFSRATMKASFLIIHCTWISEIVKNQSNAAHIGPDPGIGHSEFKCTPLPAHYSCKSFILS